MLRRLVLIGVTLCLLGHIATAEIRESGVEKRQESSNSVWTDLGYGSLAAVSNVVYIPVKLVYASLGLITGGLAYLLTFGNSDASMAIWYPSVGGSYVVTPAMLRSEEPVLFSGESYTKD